MVAVPVPFGIWLVMLGPVDCSFNTNVSCKGTRLSVMESVPVVKPDMVPVREKSPSVVSMMEKVPSVVEKAKDHCSLFGVKSSSSCCCDGRVPKIEVKVTPIPPLLYPPVMLMVPEQVVSTEP